MRRRRSAMLARSSRQLKREVGRPDVDPYDVLGIEVSANAAERKRAFRVAVRSCHPDTDGRPEAASRFREVMEAWAILHDPADARAVQRRGRGSSAVVFYRRRPPLVRAWLGVMRVVRRDVRHRVV